MIRPWIIILIGVIALLTILIALRVRKVEGFGEFKDSQMAFANKQYTYFHDTVNKGIFVNPGLNLSMLNTALQQPDMYLPKSLDRDYTSYLQPDPENAFNDQDKQFCKKAKHPKDLPPRTKGSSVSCGWYFVSDPSVPSVGVLGTKESPIFKDDLPPNGEWIYDISLATKKEDIKFCKRVRTCELMDLDGIKGVCGFCERLGYGVPINKNGAEKYPDSVDGSCGENTLNSSADCSKPRVPVITTSDGISCGTYGRPSGDNSLRSYTPEECSALGGIDKGNGECTKPQGGSFSWECRGLNTPASISEGVYGSDFSGSSGSSGSSGTPTSVCSPNSSGKLSRDCLLSLASGIGFNKSGAVLRLVQSGNTPNQLDNEAIQIVSESGISVPNAILGGGDIDTFSAGTLYKKLFDAMTSGQNDGVKQAAKYLVVGGEFDPCAGGVVNATCLQQAFRKAGCQAAGAAYPSESVASKYESMEMATDAFRELYTGMKSDDPIIQDASMKSCLGFGYYRKPKKEKPVPSSTSGAKVVCGVNSSDNIYCADQNIETSPNWTQIGGALKHVAVASGKLYGANVNDQIYGADDYKNAQWVNMPGALKQISVDSANANVVCGVNSSDNIYCADNGNKQSPNWVQVPGSLKHVSVSNGKLAGVNRNDEIYSADDYKTANWSQVPGALKQVSLDDNIMCGVNSNEAIYCNDDYKTGNWWQVPGSLKYVSVKDKQLYGANSNDDIYYNPDYKTGNWRQIPGKLKQVELGN